MDPKLLNHLPLLVKQKLQHHTSIQKLTATNSFGLTVPQDVKSKKEPKLTANELIGKDEKPSSESQMNGTAFMNSVLSMPKSIPDQVHHRGPVQYFSPQKYEKTQAAQITLKQGTVSIA